MNTIKPTRFADEMYPDAAALRRAFNDPHQMFGPYIYMPVVNSGENATALRAEKLIASYKKDRYAGVIPYYPSEAESRPFETGYEESLRAIYDACAAYGLKSAY
ncbi:MAG: hypothetical protein E7662_04605, partial [Ruminococcaceae bacterium]|nr:hypothetical protein [Oscillospiraceae bacterium]